MARVGDIIDAPLPESQYLIGIGKAEKVIDEPSPVEEPIVTPDPVSCPPVKPTKRRKTNDPQPRV